MLPPDRSDLVGGSGHELRSETHQGFDRCWQFGTAGLDGGGRVVAFIGSHLFEDAAAALILGWEFFKVFVEMAHHLTFGLGDKAEAPFVANRTGDRADRK